jgi:hypothetical protein
MPPAGIGQLGADHVRAVHLAGQRHLPEEHFVHAPQLLPLLAGDPRAAGRYKVKVAATGLKVPQRKRPMCPQRDQWQYPLDIGRETIKQRLYIVGAHDLTIVRK